MLPLFQTATTTTTDGGLIPVEGPDPTTINPLDADFWDPMIDEIQSFRESFVAFIPRLVVGIVALVIGLVVARIVTRAVHASLSASRADDLVVELLANITKYGLYVVAALFGLSAAGIPIGTVLGGMAVLGLAIAFAVQDIGENLISGVLVMLRKPFTNGDQIITGDYEGTVSAIDLRATTLIDYDGEKIIVPNRDVYRNPLINLTERGSRRTRVMVGVSYDDDQDLARNVIARAARAVDGVLDTPAVQVYLTQLGDSSVDFEIRYWTEPDIASVQSVQDRMISAVKRALDESGFTIPWPIRTLKFDTSLQVGAGEAPAARTGDGG